MIALVFHSASLLVGVFIGLFLGMVLVFWICKDDFSKGWDCGYKCGKESIERNENYWHEN